MWQNKQPYQELGDAYLDKIKPEKTANRLLKRLAKLGYVVTVTQVPISPGGVDSPDPYFRESPLPEIQTARKDGRGNSALLTADTGIDDPSGVTLPPSGYRDREAGTSPRTAQILSSGLRLSRIRLIAGQF